MKKFTEYINYQDPLTVSKVFEKAAKVHEEKQIEEHKKIERMIKMKNISLRIL